jgi:hypothetical protein
MNTSCFRTGGSSPTPSGHWLPTEVMMSHSESGPERRPRPRSVVLPPFEVDCSSWLADSVPPETGPFVQISRIYGPPGNGEENLAAGPETLMPSVFPIETENPAANIKQWFDVVETILARALAEVRKVRADDSTQALQQVAVDELQHLSKELHSARSRMAPPGPT